jgi:monoamine oxidase
MALTRRALLEQIGKAGGLGAAYLAMETLGLAIPTPASAENFRVPPAGAGARSVVVLGAGISGLVSAYELRRAGYRVTVLEARGRIGGRSWTIRTGDRIVQNGRPDQIATFDPGLYFNAGPARIPSTHRVILGYARRFGVELETFVNVNRNAGWDFGGKLTAIRDRRRQIFGGPCASAWRLKRSSAESIPNLEQRHGRTFRADQHPQHADRNDDRQHQWLRGQRPEYRQ